MTVAELIQKLQDLPADLPVAVEGEVDYFEADSVAICEADLNDGHRRRKIALIR